MHFNLGSYMVNMATPSVMAKATDWKHGHIPVASKYFQLCLSYTV